MGNELADFLRQQCRQRHLSLRRLAINAGLSPGTVHNISHCKYQSRLLSLNRLADYLKVRREYLWQLAGMLPDMDYSTLGDPRLRFQLARAERLPEAARNLVLHLVDVAITSWETWEKTQTET